MSSFPNISDNSPRFSTSHNQILTKSSLSRCQMKATPSITESKLASAAWDATAVSLSWWLQWLLSHIWRKLSCFQSRALSPTYFCLKHCLASWYLEPKHSTGPKVRKSRPTPSLPPKIMHLTWPPKYPPFVFSLIVPRSDHSQVDAVESRNICLSCGHM